MEGVAVPGPRLCFGPELPRNSRAAWSGRLPLNEICISFWMQLIFLFICITVIIFLDLKCPRDRQVRSEFRHSTAVDHPFFNNVRFDFVTLFAQLWLNVFCLRSQNELKNFHSALQISQWNDVNLLWEFSLTYNGLNDILISSNGLYFIFSFICQSWHMLEMLSLEAGTFYVQVSYTNKLGGVQKPSFLGII